MRTPLAETKIVKKGWGYERWLFNTDRLCVKELVVYYGKRCSMHFHKNKQEVFYVLKGQVVIDLIDTKTAQIVSQLFEVGDSIIIDPLVPHQIIGTSEEPAMILESSTHHEDSDSYRVLTGDSQNESKSSDTGKIN